MDQLLRPYLQATDESETQQRIDEICWSMRRRLLDSRPPVSSVGIPDDTLSHILGRASGSTCLIGGVDTQYGRLDLATAETITAREFPTSDPGKVNLIIRVPGNLPSGPTYRVWVDFEFNRKTPFELLCIRKRMAEAS